MGLKMLQKWLILCLLIVVAMALFCALELHFLPDVAFAQEDKYEDKYDVRITADNYAQDGIWDWQATCSGDVICEIAGAKFVTGDETAASYKIELAIREWLKKKGHIIVDGEIAPIRKYCELSFEFSNFDAQLVSSEVAYTQNIRATAAIADIAGTPEVKFKYKKKDGSDEKTVSADYDYASGNYTLSTNNMECGEYLVRIVAYDVINFEKNEDETSFFTYPVGRESEWMELSIKQAVPNLPSSLAISGVEYGTTLSEMDTIIREKITENGKTALISGNFIPSDNQTDKIFEDVSDIGNTLLAVSDESVIVVFDFVPANRSYAIMQVSVAVKMAPKQVGMYIKDAYSLVGEPMIIPEYYFVGSSPFVGDDTADDLGVFFEYVHTTTGEIGDGSIEGAYLSVAKCSNPNYTIYARSSENVFEDRGGRYWIYNNSIEGIFCDDIEFYVLTTWEIQDGVRVEMTRLTNIDEPLVVEDKIFVSAYSIKFFDKNGAQIEPKGDYLVRWEKNPENATWVSLYDGGFSFVKADPDRGITLNATQDKIYFFIDKDKPVSLVALYVVVGILGAGGICAVCAVVVCAIRRKLICKKNYKNYVYQYEIAQRSADCDNNVQNKQQNKTEKTVVKKSRHGKKNKQINGSKRDQKQ